MEKLSVHNFNKPPFCSLSILHTLPVSSALQLAATQHLLIAAGYVSETLIEQQKCSSFKQTALVNRPDCCERSQDWSCTGSRLEMVFFNTYSGYCYSTCTSLGRCCRCFCLTWPFSCEWASRHVSLHFGRLGCYSARRHLDVQERKTSLATEENTHQRKTLTKYPEGPASPSHCPQWHQALILGI